MLVSPILNLDFQQNFPIYQLAVLNLVLPRRYFVFELGEITSFSQLELSGITTGKIFSYERPFNLFSSSFPFLKLLVIRNRLTI